MKCAPALARARRARSLAASPGASTDSTVRPSRRAATYTARSTAWSARVNDSSRRTRAQVPPTLPRLSIRSASWPPRSTSTASPANPFRARAATAAAAASSVSSTAISRLVVGSRRATDIRASASHTGRWRSVNASTTKPGPHRRDVVLLEGKNAVIYGGGGAIGGAVARAFAREGARVFLAGRTLASLDLPRRRAGGPVRGDGPGGLPPAGRHRRADHLPDLAGRRPPHGPAGGGRDPGLRRVGRPAARLLPGRPPGRLRGHRGHAPPALLRAGAARRAVRDPADRRGARDDPARRRGDGGGRRRHRAPDHAGAAARLEDAGNVAAFVASDRAPHHDRGHRQPQLPGPERLRDTCLQAASGRAIWEVRSLPLAVVAASRLG